MKFFKWYIDAENWLKIIRIAKKLTALQTRKIIQWVSKFFE